jgi:hypothetical protein
VDKIDPVGSPLGECQLYKQFIDKTWDMYALYMTDLYKAYNTSRYTFKDHFKHVERIEMSVSTQIDKENFINYIKLIPFINLIWTNTMKIRAMFCLRGSKVLKRSL